VRAEETGQEESKAAVPLKESDCEGASMAQPQQITWITALLKVRILITNNGGWIKNLEEYLPKTLSFLRRKQPSWIKE